MTEHHEETASAPVDDPPGPEPHEEETERSPREPQEGDLDDEDGHPDGADVVDEDEHDLSPSARDRRRAQFRQRSAGFDAHTYIGAVYIDDGRGIGFGGTGPVPEWTPPVGHVSPQHLRTIERSYVPAPNDPYLVDTLTSERLVFLNGPEHSGRATSAMVALAGWGRAQGREHPHVGVLAADEDFVSLTSRVREPGGYLVDATERDWAHDLTQAALAEVRSELDRRDGALVVLVDTPVPTAAVSPHVVRHRSPDTDRVCRAALGRHLPEAELVRALGLNSEEPAVLEWGREMVTPAEAVALAESLVERWHHGVPAGSRVPEQRHRLMCEWARRLLGTGPATDSPTRQAYVLATAVLDGHAVSTVVRAAAGLDQGFHRAQGTDEERGREVFDVLLHHRIRHVRVEREEHASGRAAPRHVIRLRHPRLADALLDVLWSEFDTARVPFVSWLRWLCSDQDPRVRISAAQALGRLAGLDLAEIKRRVLLPLAASGRAVDHQAASWLLEKAYKDGVRAREVRTLLRSWARSGRWSQAAVALRAYTTVIAREHPEEALRGVREAVLAVRGRDRSRGGGVRSRGRHPRSRGTSPRGEKGGPDLRSSFALLAAAALAELYAAGDDEDKGKVLAELLGWIRLEGHTPREVPQAFVRIVMVPRRGPDDAVGDASGDTPEDIGNGYDLLERLASGRPGALTIPAVAALWATALLEPALSGAAWDHLTRWDGSAPSSGPVRQTTEDLLGHLGKIAPLTSRINLYLAFREHRDGPGRAPTEEDT